MLRKPGAKPALPTKSGLQLPQCRSTRFNLRSLRFRNPQVVVGEIPRFLEQYTGGFGLVEMCICRHLGQFGVLGCRLCRLNLGFGRLVLGGLGVALTLNPKLSCHDALAR
jgi:hypothetical protein